MVEFLPGIEAFGTKSSLQNGHFFNEWKNGTEHKGDNNYYIQHFNDEVLKNKTCRQVLADLQKLTGVKNDFSKIILLCYEKPGDFCHRHLVADWLTKNGVNCIEWT